MDKEYRLVLIEWVDLYGCSPRWEDIDDCSPSVLLCRSVGWLIHDDPICAVVVPHMSQANHPNATQQGCGDMTIPHTAIKRMVDLPYGELLEGLLDAAQGKTEHISKIRERLKE